jgi:Tol biopolymer transport system component
LKAAVALIKIATRIKMIRKFLFILICLYSVLFLFCQSQKDSPIPEQNQAELQDYVPEVEFMGKIVFQSDMDGDHEIYLLTKNKLKKLTDNKWSDENPKWSPDGKKISFTANPGGKYEIFMMNADGTDPTQLTTNVRNPIGHSGNIWHPDGTRIVYTIERRPGVFKRCRMEMVDIQSKAIEALAPELNGKAAITDFSPAEPLIGITAKRTIGWEVAVYHLRTKELSFLTSSGGISCRPHFSHDGEKIAFISAVGGGKGDIWLMNPDGSEKTKMTQREKTFDYFPCWSPNDKFIMFSSTPRHKKLKGNWALYLLEVKNRNVTLFLDTPGADLFPDWYR